MIKTIQKYIELIILFIIAPLIAFTLVHDHRVPLVLILLPMFFIFLLVLVFDRSFNWREFWFRGFGLWDTTRIIALFIVAGAALTALAWHYESRHFLAFVKSRPQLWMIVMIFYPLISVTTQELMYRVVFFHRYASLFGSGIWLQIFINAALFAYCHIIFQNWYAIIITFVGGLLFGYTYHKTRSFWAVCLEHSLYGCLIFTVGMGRYFFTGVSNVSF